MRHQNVLKNALMNHDAKDSDGETIAASAWALP